MARIRVGQWRDDGAGPMQVISGPIGRERVHYTAPPAPQVGARRHRTDLEGLQSTDIARLGQSHDLGQLGAEPGVGRFGEIRRDRKRAGLRLIEDGLAFADHRGSRCLRFVNRRRDRFHRRFGVAIV